MQQQGSGSSPASTQASIAPPCPAIGLTDEELTAHGLVKIQAYTRTTSGATGSATRAKRAREKAAASGARQLNVTAPLAAHPALRAIAKDLQAGSALCDVLRGALTAEVQKTAPFALVTVTTDRAAAKAPAMRQKTNVLAAWKTWVATWWAMGSKFFCR
jgi:hypothetical protein